MTGPGRSPYEHYQLQHPKKTHKIRNTALGVVGGLFILIVIAAIAGGGNKSGRTDDNSVVNSTTARRQPVSSRPTSAPPVKPRTLLEQRGTGAKNTRPFATTRPWKLLYDFDCANFGGQGNFAIIVYDGENLVGLPVNELAKTGNDESNVYETGPQMHLEINSECAWHVRVIG